VARKAEWLVRLPAGIEALTRLSSVVIDARTLAGILKLNLRVAQKLLARFASAEYGGMAERRALIAGLERIAKGETEGLAAEAERKAKIRAVLDEARGALMAGSIQIAPPAARKTVVSATMADLPSTILLSSTCLRIEFANERELWQQITQLTYARLNDEDRFRVVIEGDAAAGTKPSGESQSGALGV
jgi:hypothetical protein